MRARRARCQIGKIGEHGLGVCHVGGAAVHVEQVDLVRDGQTVEHRVRRYDGAIVVREGVEDRGADAVAGSAAGDDQRIDGAVDQIGQERRAVERTGFLLGEDQIAGLGRHRVHDLAAVRAFEIDVLPRLGADLGVEEPGVADGAVDGEAGIDHRCPGGAGRADDALGLLHGGPAGSAAIGVGAEVVVALLPHHVVLHVDEDDGRVRAEADPLGPTAAFDGGPVVIAQEALPVRHLRHCGSPTVRSAASIITGNCSRRGRR